MKKTQGKSLVATTNRVTQVKTVLQFPVAQSSLPIQNVKQPSQQLPRERMYNNDARNPICVLTLTTEQNNFQSKREIVGQNIIFDQDSKQEIKIRKANLLDMFSKLEKIQDELNAYN